MSYLQKIKYLSLLLIIIYYYYFIIIIVVIIIIIIIIPVSPVFANARNNIT